MDIGSAVGRANGVTETQLADMARFAESDAFSELERLVIRYAMEMTMTPVDVSDATFAALRGHFDDAQLVELTAAIAWENYRARFNHALGIAAQGFSAGAFCVLPETSPRV
jgi:alkylhydroperoxidase family enzyme